MKQDKTNATINFTKPQQVLPAEPSFSCSPPSADAREKGTRLGSHPLGRVSYFRKVLIWLIIFCFIVSTYVPAYGYTLIPEYLCELGLNLYKQGYIQDALQEFKKALIANPYYKPAQDYIRMIQEKLAVEEPTLPKPLPKPEEPSMPKPLPKPLGKPQEPPLPKPLSKPEEKKEIIPKPSLPSLKEKDQAMEKLLRQAEPASIEPKAMPKQTRRIREREKAGEKIAAVKAKEIALPKVLVLDEALKTLTAALEIEQGKSIVISGHNIQRFLLTQPEVLKVERRDSDELLVTGGDFGYTYLHTWDDNGRWTLEFLTVPLKPQVPTYEEVLRRREERANAFKLRYNMDWNSFYTSLDGDFSNLKKTSYSYTHYLYLTGPAPYGDIDSSLSVRKLKTSTDLTYLSFGLTKGNIGPFKDFTLRAVDYSASIVNLSFSSPTLRGVMLKSPAFNKTLDYTVFWGREGGGRFGGLSPGLAKTRHSFLSGMSMDYLLRKDQKYGLSVFHGWGRDRPGNLNRYGYDSYAGWNLGKWDLRYEIGYDSENLAHLFTTKYEAAKLKITEEVRNTDKKFVTMTGTGWRAGELGSLTTLRYAPSENFDIDSRLDIFRDRLFPNPKKTERWNSEFRTDAAWRLDPLTSFRSDYSFINDVGKVSPLRSFNTGLGFYKTFDWKRKVSTSLNYRHQENKHFTSPKLDFINDKISMGLRFGLARDLYYFLNKEFNWLKERFTTNNSLPEVLEMGLDWSSQVLKSQFYSSFRLLYRDEKNTDSPLSFLSGEDYIEGYGTLSYRPQADWEWYLSSRLRKIWPENIELNRRIEADFNAGFRYLWDTGIRWEPIGTIDGFVFRDLNSDGLRQEAEEPIGGIKLWLGKRSAVTDALGYYKFDKIRARKAYVNLDTQTLPGGFVLTVPVTQEAAIFNHQSARLNFGIISRTEIWGIVFLDNNGDSQFKISDGDRGIKGAGLVLENGLKAFSDGAGQYRFPNVSVGEHTIVLDLNTLPVEYLPTIPLIKTVVVFEGVSYNYNIPTRLSNK